MGAQGIVLRGGRLVMEEGVVDADLVMSDGTIKAIVSSGEDVDGFDEFDEFDATGKYVIPGIVDPHCHFDTFTHHVDDLHSLSSAGLAGGVTTMIPFLIPGGREGQPATLAEILKHFIEVGESESVIDFSFHVALWPRWDALDEITACVDLGCSSFKMFMALPRLDRMVPDDLLVAMMAKVSDAGALSMTHAENGLVTDYLERRLIERGRTAPSDLGASRPPEMEEEATFRATCLARVAGADLYVVHVTCKGAMEAIKRSRERGWRVVGETCPQYLTLNEDEMTKRGALAKVAPPLRTIEDQEALWTAVRKGWLSSIGSDHSAHRKEVKDQDDVFGDVPFGAAMIETMLPVLYSEGVQAGRLSVERLVELGSRNPAKIFGLYPRKGTLRPGADADVVVIDPDGGRAVDPAEHKDKSGYSLYDGWRLKGSVTSVFRSGRLAVSEGALTEGLSAGRYLPRESSAIPEELL